MRLLFWGTPDFATPALRAIVGEGYDVVAVVTQPDRAQGRSRTELVPPPVKVVALEEGIPVLQPEQPKGDPAFLAQLRDLQPDLSVVVAYGHLLSQELLDLPRLGTWNIHASLLPRWRGAAPIQAAILAGDVETGVSIMRMVRKMDAGPVIVQAPTPIAPDETGGELTERLAELGALGIIEALTLLALGGGVEEHPQDDARVTLAPKLTRDAARLEFHRPAVDVARAIRAFDPRPGAWTTLRGDDTKLFGALTVGETHGAPGEVLDIDEHGALVACAHGGVRVGYLQVAGKRRLAALDLSQGRGLAVGDVLGG
ncbi:MAG: methionyl-tRNA formyltransferase [Gemmatimonadaceae bacterium]|nr:methionyl-tRNA formyltransferase [Gemmatimonadaceae bacterium]